MTIDWKKPIRFNKKHEVQVRVVAGPLVDGRYVVECDDEISALIEGSGISLLTFGKIENIPEPMVRVKAYVNIYKANVFAHENADMAKSRSADDALLTAVEFAATIPESVAIAAGLEYEVIK